MRSYDLIHRTTYNYGAPVSVSRHTGYLKPISSQTQHLAHFNLAITPSPQDFSERHDYFENEQVHFQISESHQTLIVETRAHVRVTASPPDDLLTESSMSCGELQGRLKQAQSVTDLRANIMTHPSFYTRGGSGIQEFAAKFLQMKRPFADGVMALNTAIHEQFKFDPDATDISTPVDDVFAHKRGVCQDFAHLMLACLRSHQLPARYVSGYILTHPPEGQRRLEGADASHAWVAVWLPGLGWVDFDPTNNMVCGDEHITVATGRDYADVSPLRGAVIGGGDQKIDVAVTVRPTE